MSSATNSNPAAAREMVYQVPGKGEFKDTATDPTAVGAAQLGLSPRQMALNRLWSFYRCSQYESRSIDWNGNEHLDHLEHEVVAQSNSIPPGFHDSGQQMPLKFRRPDAPYHMTKVVVNRFTGLLFSQKRHPTVTVPDDPETEDWLQGFAEVTRLWPRMIQARAYGGAMGSVGAGFKFVEGKPVFEIHDPRWCEPTFEDRLDSDTVIRLEKRYMYPE